MAAIRQLITSAHQPGYGNQESRVSVREPFYSTARRDVKGFSRETDEMSAQKEGEVPAAQAILGTLRSTMPLEMA